MFGRFGKKEAEKKEAEKKEDEAPFVYSSDPNQAGIERRVANVFDVFDASGLKVVDVREVGTMMRALDLCPTEADVQEIIVAVEEPSTKGTVKFSTFVKYATFVILEGLKYQQRTKDEMMKFFLKLDRERKGTIEPVKLKDVIQREGEPFTAEEADEMISFAMNKDDGLIYYEEYVDKTLAALRTLK